MQCVTQRTSSTSHKCCSCSILPTMQRKWPTSNKVVRWSKTCAASWSTQKPPMSIRVSSLQHTARRLRQHRAHLVHHCTLIRQPNRLKSHKPKNNLALLSRLPHHQQLSPGLQLACNLPASPQRQHAESTSTANQAYTQPQEAQSSSWPAFPFA